MRRGATFWGGLLILVGFVLVLNNLGLLGNIDIWGIIWPLFLVLLGVWFIWGTINRRPAESEHVEIPHEDAQSAHVVVQHGAGRLHIAAGTSQNNLLEGDFGGGLDFHAQRKGDQLNVRMRMPSQYLPIFWTPGSSLDWSFNLSKEVPLSLEIGSGANDTRLELTELKIHKLIVKSGVSSTTVHLPASAGLTQVRVESGVSSVNLYVPEGVAARVRSQGGLSSINVDRNRFPKSGGIYQSTDYEQAENKLDINVQMGVGSVFIK
ncbi:MAG: hypothetical protein JSV61_13935 [Anaerolineales bacterium]|nr:MAG: hypothetical protein JSV61_13935 [Anaerolineales bacterium]